MAGRLDDNDETLVDSGSARASAQRAKYMGQHYNNDPQRKRVMDMHKQMFEGGSIMADPLELPGRLLHVYVCVYVYMHACMHVCTYVCMYVYMLCMYICYVCMYVYMYVCMYVYMYVSTSANI